MQDDHLPSLGNSILIKSIFHLILNANWLFVEKACLINLNVTERLVRKI